MNTPIAGYDFARLLALLGLLATALITAPIPDFEAGGFELRHLILGQLHSFIRGGVIATFLLLGGVGISLRIQQSRTTDDVHRITDSRKRLIRRAALLMVVGIGCNLIFPIDLLLSSYGGYILFGALLLTVSNRWLWSLASACVIIRFALVFLVLHKMYSLKMLEESWVTPHVFGFSVGDMIYNLLSDGLYSLSYWSVFLLMGMWLGRQEVPFPIARRNLFLRAMVIALVTSCVLLVLLSTTVWSRYSSGSDSIPTWWQMVTGVIISFLNGGGAALAIIMGSLRLIEKCPDAKWTKPFIATRRFARLFSVAHLVRSGSSEVLQVREKQKLSCLDHGIAGAGRYK